MKKIKRLVAILLSTVILIGSCAVVFGLMGQAGAADYSVQYRHEGNYTSFTLSDADYAALGKNLLGGKIATPYQPADDGLSHTKITNLDSAATKLAMLTDGAVSDSGDGKSRAQLYLTGGTALPKIDLEYDLGTICSVEKFTLISMQNTRDFSYYTKFYTGKYEVYLGNDKDTLYSAENLIYSYDYKDMDQRSGAQLVTFNNVPSGRYFAVRILDTLSLEGTDTASAYARIAEIGLFGEKVTNYTVEHRREDHDGTDLLSDAEYSALGTNLLKNSLAVVYDPGADYNSHTQISYSSLNGGEAELLKLTDGTVSNNGGGDCWAQIRKNGSGEDRYIDRIDLEYDLGSNCEIDKFVLVSIQDQSTRESDVIWHANKYLGEYEVYLADSKDTLYNAENLIYSYNYKDEAKRSGVQYVTFKTSVSGKYLAVRIKNPISPNDGEDVARWPRIAEIGVFGKSSYTVNYRDENSYGSFTYTNASYAALGTNLIKDNVAKAYKPEADGTHTPILNLDNSDIKLGMLTDGTVEDDGTDASWAKLFLKGGSSAGNVDTLDIEYDLQNTSRVDKFVFVSIQNPRDFAWHSALYIGKYEVYLADSKEDLYKPETLIYSYDYKNLGKPAGVQEVTFSEPLSGRYLAVRILDPVSKEHTENTHIYPRIAEIGVFGDNGLNYTVEYRKETKLADMMTDADFAKLGNNLLSGRVAAPYALDIATGNRKYLIGNEVKTENLNGATDSLIKLTDGKVYDGTSSLATGLYYYGGAGLSSIDLEYNLGSVCTVNKFVLLGSSFIYEENLAYSMGLYTGKYEVYLSNDKENLYNAENLIYAYDYEQSSIARGQVVTFKNAVKGKYLAIRILDPVTTATEYVYPRLSEIALFGEDGLNYKVEYISEPVDGPVMTNKEFASIGNSIINGMSPRLLLNGVANSTLEWQNSGNLMNDGDLSQSTNFRWVAGANGECYVDIIYELGEDPIDFEKFAFIGYKNPWKHYYTGHYTVYIAMDYDDLFLSDTLVYEYDRTVDQIARGQIVTFKEKPRGCYLAVRILDPNMLEFDHNDEDHLWIAPKISEIGAYGTKAVIISSPTNLAENMPVEAYITEKNGSLSKIPDNKFSAADVKKLTDASYDSDVAFDANGKNITLVYNLCKDMKIDKMRLSSSGLMNKPDSVKIYASTDYNAIWSEKSLIYSGKYDTAEIKCGKEVRYVRIVVSGSKRKFGISEIEIIGMDNQKLKYKNLARSINSANIQFFAQNNKNGFVSYLDIDSSVAKGLVDNDKNTLATVEGGNPERETLNIQMYLGDLKTIDSVSVYFTDKTAYQPKKLYVYVCQSEEELLKADLKPIAELKGLPENGAYTINFAPILGRYIRISIPESNPEQDDYDTYCIGFTEIAITGTSVVGTQTDRDNDALLSYSNKNYNISWDVIRIDTNDITTKIASSKLVRTSATEAQKESLHTAMYKVVGDSVFEIQFFDITGNRVYDIDGRLVRINTPIGSELLGGQMLFGNASDKEVIELYETLENNENSSRPYIYYELTEADGYKFTVTQLTDSEDPYWEFMNDGISDDTGSDDTVSDGNGENEPLDGSTDGTSDDTGRLPLILIIIAGAVLVAGAAVVVMIIIKKRKNN